MHILISRYLDNGNSNLNLNKNLWEITLVLRLSLNMSQKFISDINKVLEKYQIEIASCMDGNYIKNFH